MSGAREYDPVRTRTAVESVFDGRVVPAGAEGAALNARPGGLLLAGVALAPQTADDDGDFGQAVPGDGQYEVIRVHDQDQGGTRPGPTSGVGARCSSSAPARTGTGTRSRAWH